jgi:hypothetical protein
LLLAEFDGFSSADELLLDGVPGLDGVAELDGVVDAEGVLEPDGVVVG